MTDATPDFAEVARRLNEDIEPLARAILGEPSHRTKTEWRFGRKGSLSIEISGAKRGLWHDFEAGKGGDAIDLICARLDVDKAGAFAYGYKFLGIDPDPNGTRKPNGKAQSNGREANGADRSEIEIAGGRAETAAREAKVEDILKTTGPVRGTSGEIYLTRTRGIPDAVLRQPNIGYRPKAWHDYETREIYGALVFKATDDDGNVRAVQQIYLTEDGKKAAIKVQKRTNGFLKDTGAAVRFIGDCDTAELVLAEGTETASAVWGSTRQDTWSCLGGIGNVKDAPFPCQKIILARDADQAGSPGDRALLETAAHIARRGYGVRIATPPVIYGDLQKTDFNDTLRREGPDAINRAIADAVPFVAKAQQEQPPSTDGDEPDEPLAVAEPTTLAGLPVPKREWIVRDLVPMKRVTGLYGAGGEGKTLLAQLLATAAAIEQRWLGLPVRRCRSVLYFCEDDLDEMHRRQEDINRFYGCSFEDLGDMLWLPRLGDDNMLMSFQKNGHRKLTRVFHKLLTIAKDFGAELVFTDTLADVFDGNELDRGQARRFGQECLGHLAREIDGAVVALAHPSMAGINSGTGSSGSTEWDGTFRSRLYLNTPKPDRDEAPDPYARRLTRKKANYALREETIELRWKDGVFVTKNKPPGMLLLSCERVFLDLLDAVIAEGRHVSDSTNAGNYAPKLFASRPDRAGYTKTDFKRAMEGLFTQKKILVSTYKGSNRTEYKCIIKQ